MRAIYKYPIPIRGGAAIDMPAGAQIRALQVQNGAPYLWAEVDTDAEPAPRWFVTFGTGHLIPDGFVGEYRGTYQLMGGALVFHVYERLWPVIKPRSAS